MLPSFTLYIPTPAPPTLPSPTVQHYWSWIASSARVTPLIAISTSVFVLLFPPNGVFHAIRSRCLPSARPPPTARALSCLCCYTTRDRDGRSISVYFSCDGDEVSRSRYPRKCSVYTNSRDDSVQNPKQNHFFRLASASTALATKERINR